MPQERVQEKRTEATTKTEPAPEVEDKETAEVKAKGEKLKAELDEILDGIDEVLESEAQAFVEGYQQKGGQ
jgi:ubiquitin-like protein Pup